MHLEILSPEQAEILSFIKKYVKQYYLVGGTAVALHKYLNHFKKNILAAVGILTNIFYLNSLPFAKKYSKAIAHCYYCCMRQKF